MNDAPSHLKPQPAADFASWDICGAYVWAVTVATLVTSVLMTGWMVWMRPEASGSLLSFFSLLVVFGWFFTGVTAFPGFIAVVLLASAASIRSPLYFAFGGLLTAFSSIVIVECGFGDCGVTASLPALNRRAFQDLLPLLIGGAAGGYAYGRYRLN